MKRVLEIPANIIRLSNYIIWRQRVKKFLASIRTNIGIRAFVGTVADTRRRGLQKASKAEMYLPYDQAPVDYYLFAPGQPVIRTSGDPEDIAPATREAIWDDRLQPFKISSAWRWSCSEPRPPWLCC